MMYLRRPYCCAVPREGKSGKDLLEFGQHPLLGQLIGAVFDVDVEVLRSVLEKDIANVPDNDTLLPSTLQVAQ